MSTERGLPRFFRRHQRSSYSLGKTFYTIRKTITILHTHYSRPFVFAIVGLMTRKWGLVHLLTAGLTGEPTPSNPIGGG